MSWEWSLNWDVVTPDLLIGSCPMEPDDLDRIRSATGISAVLSLQHDDCLRYWNIDYGAMRQRADVLGLAMARCPIRDFDIADMRRHLGAAVGHLARLRRRGHRVYVHCTAGLGRAPLTVLGYLAWVEGEDPETAIRAIHDGRPGAVPAWEAFRGCREDLATRHRAAIERRAHELSRTRPAGDAARDWLEAEGEILRAVLGDGDDRG